MPVPDTALPALVAYNTPETSRIQVAVSIIPVALRPVSVCELPASRSPPPVQARKGAGQIRNLFQFAMLFEKSKEKSKIRTWYHKSFLSTSRVSELGRPARDGRRGAGKNSLLKQASRGRGLRGTTTAICRHHCSETLRKTLYPSRGSAHIHLEVSVHTNSRHNKQWQMKRGRQISPFL